MKIVHTILNSIALLFGVLTIVAGIRVLFGSDPGYIVYIPLLIYNTIMGLAYVFTGIIAFRNVKRELFLASGIFSLNFIVLAVISFMYKNGAPIAINSVVAMSFRTIVWFILTAGYWWLKQGKTQSA